MDHKGLRFNSGKLRTDLIPPSVQEELAKILTKGASKYKERNWEAGMSWNSVISSLKRHLLEIEKGVDFDPETKELHISHLLCNAAFLVEYYHTYPQGDDRNLWFKKPFKSVLIDIDGCLGAFEEHFLKKLGMEGIHANDWNDPIFRNNFDKVANDENFWLTLPKLEEPEEITYPIKGYCTSRSISKEVTQRWLDFNRFPTGELISLKLGESKVDALKGKCDVFLDDSIKNFVELQSNGILCYLKTRPHNVKYDVGNYRVESLKEFFERVRNLT